MNVALEERTAELRAHGYAAAQIAVASATSFLLPLFTNGVTASGAISFTSC